MFRISVSLLFAAIISIVSLACPVKAEIENRYESESIGVFEHIGYEHKNWADPVKAKFRPIRMLKGPKCCRDLPVHYGFRAKHTKYTMPLRGSMWILFIPVAIPTVGMFETFHEGEGRIN